MKISRDWATPLTIGAFAIMAVTGLLMFFHADVGLNKLAHEWLGWLMVAGVAAHVVANWNAFKRHLVANMPARAILGICIVLLAGSFASLPGSGEGGGSPPAIAIKAITGASIEKVAALAGRSVDEVMTELGKVGIAVSDPAASLESVVGHDRGKTGAAIRAIFANP